MRAAEVIIRRLLMRESSVEMSLGMVIESRSFRVSSIPMCNLAVLDLANHVLIFLTVQFAFTTSHIRGEDTTIRYHRFETRAHIQIWGILSIYRYLISGNHFAYDIIAKRRSSGRREMGARSVRLRWRSSICLVRLGSPSPSNL
jgi:hypothetical protein